MAAKHSCANILRWTHALLCFGLAALIWWATGSGPWIGLAKAQATSTVSAPSTQSSDPKQLPTNWQQLSLNDLPLVIQKFDQDNRNSTDPAIRSQWQQLAAFLWSTFLAQDSQLPAMSEADRNNVIYLVSYCTLSFSQDQQATLIQRFTAMANDQNWLSSTSFATMYHLCSALKEFKQPPNQFPLIAARWFNASNQWNSLDQNSLERIEALFKGDQTPQNASVRSQIVEKSWSVFLNTDAYYTSTSLGHLRDDITLFGWQLDPTRQATIAAKLVQRFTTASADLSTIQIQQLPSYVAAVRLAQGTDAQAANVIAAWALARDQRSTYTIDDGGAYKEGLSFDAIIKGATDTAAMAASIKSQVYTSGVPAGPTSAKLLAYMAGASGQIGPWNTELDTQLARTGLSGDVRSLLSLAKASALEVQHSDPGPLDGVTLAQQALALAQSPKLQVVAAEWIARRQAIAGDYSGAQTTIQNATNQTSDATANQLLSLLSQQVTGKQTKETAAATRAAIAAQSGALRLQGQLSFLQSQLARAQAENQPSQQIQALQNLVNSMDAQISSATTAPSP